MMTRWERIRAVYGAASVLAVSAALVCVPELRAMPGQSLDQQPPAPIERRAPSPGNAGRGGNASGTPGIRGGAARGPRGEHLAQWMSQHSALSPQQQQQAMQQEPGFHDLPAQTQQRMLQRLAQLDALPPAQRQRRLAHIEAMERLTPAQRAQVRSAMAQLGSLPPDQRRPVARTFRALRDLPAEQRVQALSSGQYGVLSETQRGVLMDLLRVEPMLPPPAAGEANPSPASGAPPMSRAFH